MLNNVMQGGMSQIGQPIYYTFRGRSAIEAVRIMDGEAESKDGYLMRAIIKLLYRYPRRNRTHDLDLAIECIKMLREEYTDPPKKREGDMIKHPDHYTFRGVEAIEVVKIMTSTATGVEAYLLGCAVKYLYRYPRKNGKQDLDKAIQCIKMLRDYLYEKKKKPTTSDRRWGPCITTSGRTSSWTGFETTTSGPPG